MGVAGIVLFLLFAGCDQKIAYQNSYKLQEKGWHKDSTLKFDARINDTVHSHSVCFTIRHTSGYPYRNIIYFVTITSPDHHTITDTVEFYLADKKGKWKGNGLGDIYNTRLIYKKNIRFPKTGTYTFEITQGMRKTVLPHVIDAGLMIKMNS
jgi:gliding motility-associated lipoprotein GldH